MEIKPQELRLTNLVEWNKEACTVQSIRGNDIGLYDRNKALICTTTKLIKPIELTPEWLTMAGFEKLNVSGFVISGATYWRRKGITIYEIEGKYMLPIGENLGVSPGRTVIQFDKLHELQNIFALTGEELAIDKQLSNGN